MVSARLAGPHGISGPSWTPRGSDQMLGFSTTETSFCPFTQDQSDWYEKKLIGQVSSLITHSKTCFHLAGNVHVLGESSISVGRKLTVWSYTWAPPSRVHVDLCHITLTYPPASFMSFACTTILRCEKPRLVGQLQTLSWGWWILQT